jgi:hypothetical protein
MICFLRLIVISSNALAALKLEANVTPICGGFTCIQEKAQFPFLHGNFPIAGLPLDSLGDSAIWDKRDCDSNAGVLVGWASSHRRSGGCGTPGDDNHDGVRCVRLAFRVFSRCRVSSLSCKGPMHAMRSRIVRRIPINKILFIDGWIVSNKFRTIISSVTVGIRRRAM